MICTGSHQSNATNRARAIIHKVCSDVTDICKTVENKTSNDLQLTIAYSKNLTIFCESYCKIASHGSCLLGQGHWLHTECIHIFHITNANNCGAVIQAALINSGSYSMSRNHEGRGNCGVPWLYHRLLRAPVLPPRDIRHLVLEGVKPDDNLRGS